MKQLTVDICIIGAGAGGLTVAAIAAQLDISVVLIESGKMGGDCLNYGCVPSKSLLQAAKITNQCRHSELFGLAGQELTIDLEKVLQKVHNIIQAIAVNDSTERFEKLGVTVIHSHAKFLNKNLVQAGELLIKAKRFVIATGSSPYIPPITGLNTISYLTNETLFDLTQKPSHLLIIGGGPIGCEMAQAFLLLGVQVTLLEAQTIMPHDDADLVAILRQQLLQDGLNLYENCIIHKVSAFGEMIEATYEIASQTQHIIGSHLLVATGRKPNVEQLDLAVANIEFNAKGIKVDKRLRTTNKHIYAIGDVVGPYQFTHIANYHAGIVIRNMLFCMPTTVDYHLLPWVTYTQPELAQVGLTAKQAAQQYKNIKITTANFSENDRAQTARDTGGQIKVITSNKGTILGVSIAGPEAGELLAPWILAMKQKLSISAIAELILPYPTLSEIHKRVASNYYKDVLFSPRIKRLIKWLMRLRR